MMTKTFWKFKKRELKNEVKSKGMVIKEQFDSFPQGTVKFATREYLLT